MSHESTSLNLHDSMTLYIMSTTILNDSVPTIGEHAHGTHPYPLERSRLLQQIVSDSQTLISD